MYVYLFLTQSTTHSYSNDAVFTFLASPSHTKKKRKKKPIYIFVVSECEAAWKSSISRERRRSDVPGGLVLWSSGNSGIMAERSEDSVSRSRQRRQNHLASHVKGRGSFSSNQISDRCLESCFCYLAWSNQSLSHRSSFDFGFRDWSSISRHSIRHLKN